MTFEVQDCKISGKTALKLCSLTSLRISNQVIYKFLYIQNSKPNKTNTYTKYIQNKYIQKTEVLNNKIINNNKIRKRFILKSA